MEKKIIKYLEKENKPFIKSEIIYNEADARLFTLLKNFKRKLFTQYKAIELKSDLTSLIINRNMSIDEIMYLENMLSQLHVDFKEQLDGRKINNKKSGMVQIFTSNLLQSLNGQTKRKRSLNSENQGKKRTKTTNSLLTSISMIDNIILLSRLNSNDCILLNYFLVINTYVSENEFDMDFDFQRELNSYREYTGLSGFIFFNPTSKFITLATYHLTPKIFHYCGHSSKDQGIRLVFSKTRFSGEDISNIYLKSQSEFDVLFLNSCESSHLVRRVSMYGNSLSITNKIEVYSENAELFSEELYKVLSKSRKDRVVKTLVDNFNNIKRTTFFRTSPPFNEDVDYYILIEH